MAEVINGPRKYHHVWYNGTSWTITSIPSLAGATRPSVITTPAGEVFGLNTQTTGFLTYGAKLINLTPGSSGYGTESITLASEILTSKSETLIDTTALKYRNKLSFLATRVGNDGEDRDFVQDGTVVTVNMNDINTLRQNSNLAPTTVSTSNVAVSTASAINGGSWQPFYTSANIYSPDILGRQQYVSTFVTASVSDGSTVGEVRIRYQSSSGQTDIGQMGVTETAPTPKIVTLPLHNIAAGNIELIGSVTSGTGTLTISSFTIVTTRASLEPFPLKTDNDNFDDLVEESAPNSGDMNNDGIPDRVQSNVSSIEYSAGKRIAAAVSSTKTNADPSTITVGNCSVVDSLSVKDETDYTQDSQYSYPIGLIDYVITCDNNGNTAFTTFVLDQDYSSQTDDWVMRKYDRNTQSYSTLEESNYVIGSALIDGQTHTTVEIEATDGGLNDEDVLANGDIVDPFGPAVLGDTAPAATTTALSPSSTSGSLASTGVSIIIRLLISSSIIIAAIILFSSKHRKYYKNYKLRN